MIKNKRFALIVITLVFACVLVYGCRVFYLNYTNNLNKNYQSIKDDSCLVDSTPSIKVISPSVDETYAAGKELKISWASCNIPPSENVSIVARPAHLSQKPIDTWTKIVSSTPNNGVFYVTIDKDITPSDDYFIHISRENGLVSNGGWSSAFTINPPFGPIISCTSDTGKTMTFQRALEIAKTSSCADVGNFTMGFSCNYNSGGLIDVRMNPINKPQCGLVCYVGIDTGEAEEGWRCTGVAPTTLWEMIKIPVAPDIKDIPSIR